MKKIIRKLAIILIMALVVSNVQTGTALAVPKKYVKSLSVSKKTIKINIGEKKAFSYRVKVKGNASKKVNVKTSNSNVKVSVKKNGKIVVLGKKNGTSKITVSTKGKNRKGKKIKKTVTVHIKKEHTVSKPSVTPVPGTDPKVEVSRREWISELMKLTGYSEQKEFFEYGRNGEIAYSFSDIAGLDEAGIIETAVQYGIIPDSGGKFCPEDAADREFAAVTAVRAVGFAANEQEIDSADLDELEYVSEDAIAVHIGMITLSGDKFLPARAVSLEEKNHAVKTLSEIMAGRMVNENHKDVIEYDDDVKQEDIVDYTVSEQDDVYTVEAAEGSSLQNVSEGDKLLLPATDRYPEGMALIVQSKTASSDGKSEILTGRIPEEITDFVDAVDVEGTAEVDADNVAGIEGVSTVEVVKKNGRKRDFARKSQDKKGKSINDEIDLRDKTEIIISVNEIKTKVSFYLSALKYNIDFDRHGVKELYIGLPSVLSLHTEYKGSKDFSKKIGDVPVNLPAGLSVNIEVYLEVDIEGKISIDLELSNDVGVQYSNGQFLVNKQCTPDFDIYAEADIDAGTKLQMGLYWMKGILEIFSKEDPRPLYNVHTKWGMHGDAAVHIRNDEYTSFEDLSCVDLGYYLYGNVGTGDGSFLGEEFSLKKTWKIYDRKNSPLKGEWHFENGEKVDKCTYKVGAITKALKKYAENYSYYCDEGSTYNKFIVGNGGYSYYNEMSITPLTFDIDDGIFCYEILDDMPVKPLTFDIDDYDSDGNPELLIVQSHERDGMYPVYPYEKVLYLEMYEYENGEVVKKSTSDYIIERKYDKPFYVSAVAMVEGETTVYTFDRNNTLAIAMESHDTKSCVGGSANMQFWLLKYNGNSFETIVSGDYPYAWGGDARIERIEKVCDVMGLDLDAERFVSGKEKFLDYTVNPKIIGKSETKITEDFNWKDFNWSEMWEEDPFGEYEAAEITFSK